MYFKVYVPTSQFVVMCLLQNGKRKSINSIFLCLYNLKKKNKQTKGTKRRSYGHGFRTIDLNKLNYEFSESREINTLQKI